MKFCSIALTCKSMGKFLFFINQELYHFSTNLFTFPTKFNYFRNRAIIPAIPSVIAPNRDLIPATICGIAKTIRIMDNSQ